MLLHRSRQALGGNFEEICVERPHEDGRPFRQPGILAQQCLVLDHGETGSFSDRARLLPDRVDPVGGVQDDLALAELVHVVVEVLDRKRRIAMEAVPARLVPARHVSDSERHDLPAQNTHDRPQRTDPA